MKILYVEDEAPIATAVTQILRHENYDVDWVSDGETGLDHGLSGHYDLIILDLLLPDLDGWQIIRELRLAQISTPILLLTARSSTEDKITGLDLGADDYLTKPYYARELLARARALTRRPAPILPQGVITFHDLSLNPQTLILTCGERSVKLTLKEELIMELLLRRHDMVVAKDILIEKLYGYTADIIDNENHVEVHLHNLRKKISQFESQCQITTIRGLGYILKKQTL